MARAAQAFWRCWRYRDAAAPRTTQSPTAVRASRLLAPAVSRQRVAGNFQKTRRRAGIVCKSAISNDVAPLQFQMMLPKGIVASLAVFPVETAVLALHFGVIFSAAMHGGRYVIKSMDVRVAELVALATSNVPFLFFYFCGLNFLRVLSIQLSSTQLAAHF